VTYCYFNLWLPPHPCFPCHPFKHPIAFTAFSSPCWIWYRLFLD
jgi:hypothetical protein